MTEFFLALVAVVFASLGSREQVLIASLSARLGQHAGLIAVASIASALSAAIVAVAGSAIAALLPPAAKTMLVAMAMLFAAVEMAWPTRDHAPQEPTRSLGAIGIVLAAQQLRDGPRFLIFVIAAGFASPLFAGIGGALGGIVAALLAWGLADDLLRWRLRAVRRVLAAALAIAAIVTGLAARGLL